VVVLDEEMGNAMTVESIACKRYSPGNPAVGLFIDFEICMGLTGNDILGPVFDDNYIPGSRTTVFERDSISLSPDPDDWQVFELDTPYWYNGEDNLLIEFLWSEGETEDECLYSWHWNTGTIRSLAGEYEDVSGTMSSLVVMLRFEGSLGFVQTTHGAIKSLFAGLEHN